MRKMAASRCQHFYFLLSNYSRPNVRWRVGLRPYSVYPPYFETPTIKPQEIEKKIEGMSAKELEVIRVRAAGTHESCSVFYDPLKAKFINYIMRQGKKEKARELMEKALAEIKHQQLRKYMSEKDEEKKNEILLRPMDIMYKAVKMATPSLKVIRVKKSGTWYNVPVPITDYEAKIYAMKWLVNVSKEKDDNVRFFKVFAQELINASNGEGRAVNKKIELHKLCEASKSHVQYKWT